VTSTNESSYTYVIYNMPFVDSKDSSMHYGLYHWHLHIRISVTSMNESSYTYVTYNIPFVDSKDSSMHYGLWGGYGQ